MTDFDQVVALSKKAGDAILQIYNDPETQNTVEYKGDNSPLTLADKASHEVIMAGLRNLDSNIPIISEEGKDIAYEQRKGYNPYWLVDPLDGTKEFINRNGEFTVNIALIKNQKPVFGVVYVPVWDAFYIGEGNKAFKIDKSGKREIHVNEKSADRVAVRSKSHASPEEEGVLNTYDVKDSISVGSSLKFCMVAEGKADIYYRHGPTMEWDIAAGHAVVNGAGGKVMTGTGPDDFTYNKENLLNGSFLCLGF